MTARLKSFKTIGFFGDSFCAGSDENSWTDLLAYKLNANIINRGKDGSSIWSAILDFQKCVIPDYSIFCWTNPYRLYHPKKSAILTSIKKNTNFGDAVIKYFAYLWFEEKEILNYKWILKYHDENVLFPICDQSKIIQTFSFDFNDTKIKDLGITLKSGYFHNTSLLKFSGLTIEDHYDKINMSKKINHMNIEKNHELSDFYYKILTK
jgi:hypothetical protein